MNQQNPIPVPGSPSAPAAPMEPTVEEQLLDTQARLAAAEEAAATALEATKSVPRYAVYDTVYQRFVGPVFDRKPTKTQLTQLLKDDASTTDDVDDLEVREV